MTDPSAKKQEELVGLSRQPVVNRLNSIKDSIVKRPPVYNMHGLIDENKIKWFLENFMHLGNSRYPYQHYANPAINNGIFKIDASSDKAVTIALLSDWASDTEESRHIAELASGHDFSIHLGDTYYVGNSREIAENFNSTYGGSWPYGSIGSFAMLGNHEMYSSGKSYFTELLPYMGVYTGAVTKQQEASFFCLENDHWRVIGLDTGYYSLKGCLGLTTNPALKLHDRQMEWLRDVVRLKDDHRAIVFLSHHQPVSAFEREEYQGIVNQLTTLLPMGKQVLWIWGHEHRFTIYGMNTAKDFSFFGRCIGNGGMPVELQHPPKSASATDPKNRNLVVYDRRHRVTIDDDLKLGHNGYAVLSLKNDQLQIDYFDDAFKDETGKPGPILTECWSADLASGNAVGVSIEDHTADKGLENKLTLVGGDVARAIRQENNQ